MKEYNIYFYIYKNLVLLILKMTENERQFVESITNFESNVKKAQLYIKENYGIDSEFDIQDSAIHLTSSQAENALMLAAAREYISETFNDEVVCVMG